MLLPLLLKLLGCVALQSDKKSCQPSYHSLWFRVWNDPFSCMQEGCHPRHNKLW